MEKNEKWFLGGTCGKTSWRDELIPILKKRKPAATAKTKEIV
jgi:hypothetical protein